MTPPDHDNAGTFERGLQSLLEKFILATPSNTHRWNRPPFVRRVPTSRLLRLLPLSWRGIPGIRGPDPTQLSSLICILATLKAQPVYGGTCCVASF